MEKHHHHKSGRRGATSIDMQDADTVFEKIGLKKGEWFLDLGCGSGDYSYMASQEVGDNGKVFALDKWEGLIQVINKDTEKKGIHNIEAIKADILQDLPVPEQKIDVCLVATVLHTIHPESLKIELFKRIRQALKPGGRLITIDVKKEEHPFGPPLTLRSSPDEIRNFAESCGFICSDIVEFDYTYLIRFYLPSNS